jgi:hypothetical protein
MGCAYVSGSWTRCSITFALDATASPTTSLGSFSTASYPCTGSDGSAFDGFVTGWQCEVGAYASSYIATTSAGVARASETATVALSSAMSATTGSHAATFVSEWSTGTGAGAPYMVFYDPNGRPLYQNTTGNGTSIAEWDGTNDVINATTFAAGVSKRMWSSYAVTTMMVNDGTDTVTGSFDGTFGAPPLSTLAIGGWPGSASADGVIKQVCVDPNPSRCR